MPVRFFGRKKPGKRLLPGTNENHSGTETVNLNQHQQICVLVPLFACSKKKEGAGPIDPAP
jgi:hypothetical protein